jgi:hypothetical protein
MVGNVLQTLLQAEPPQDITRAKDFIDEALSIATHAMRTSIHTTLVSSPGCLVFNSLTAKSVLVGEKLVAMYSIST